MTHAATDSETCSDDEATDDEDGAADDVVEDELKIVDVLDALMLDMDDAEK
jgi:hypothetical protein